MKNTDILIQNGVDLAKGLELFGDQEMYDESLGDFMADIHDKLNKVASYKAAGDMQNYAIIVHALKSDAKYFGFNALAEMAYNHELESKSNNTVYVNTNYEALITEANRIIDIVSKYLSGSESPTPNNVSFEEFTSGRASLLVVDDSDIIQKFIARIFEENFNVIIANNGAEAINLIESNDTISAMLLDLNMPEVDGFAVLEYMKEKDLFKKIPVSIITGNDAKEVDLEAFKYPIVDIVKKPFNDVSLKNIVERTIGTNN